jgi:hypothetical protein
MHPDIIKAAINLLSPDKTAQSSASLTSKPVSKTPAYTPMRQAVNALQNNVGGFVKGFTGPVNIPQDAPGAQQLGNAVAYSPGDPVGVGMHMVGDLAQAIPQAAHALGGVGHMLPLMAAAMNTGDDTIHSADAIKQAVQSGSSDVTPLYHGTNAVFDKFDPERIGDVQPSDWGNGFYFTDRPDIAKNFAKVAGGNVVMERYAPNVKFADGSVLARDQEFQKVMDDDMGFSTPSEYLQKQGYGGVKYYHKDNGGWNEYVVFNPDDIVKKEELAKRLGQPGITQAGLPDITGNQGIYPKAYEDFINENRQQDLAEQQAAAQDPRQEGTR